MSKLFVIGPVMENESFKTISDSENGPAVGAGLSYALTEDWYIKGDYTYYSFEDTDTDGVMIGAGYKF